MLYAGNKTGEVLVSLSEPHTCGVNGKLSICVYMIVWYVRIPYMHSALFVRDAIFPMFACTAS